MSDFLKGNFSVKNEVAPGKETDDGNASTTIKERLRVRAMANICGSMVYIDDTALEWDGDKELEDGFNDNEGGQESERG